MKMKIQTKSFVLFVFCSILALRSVAIPSTDLLGVSPKDEEYYKGLSSSGTIRCKDESRTFTKSQFNDDFCDCADGTDEPGTSACPSGKFYCRNAGHISLSIFSSRVNDGICDCCDGSDEYNGKIKCKNTCWEAGKVARDRLKKKIATFQEGVSLRKHEVEQAKLAVAKDEAELSRLKNEENILKGLVQQLKERKEQIEKAEEKEKEENQKKEAEEAILKEHKGEDQVDVAEEEPVKSNVNDKTGILDDSPSSQDTRDLTDSGVEVAHTDATASDVSLDNGEEEYAEKNMEPSKVAHESDHHTEPGSKDPESLSKEELGRIIGSRWTGKRSEQQTEDVGSAKDNHDESYDETTDNADDEEYSGYDTETEEDPQNYEEDDSEEQIENGYEANDDSSSSYTYESDNEVDMSDMDSTSNPSWLEKIQQTVRNFLRAINPFQTPVNTSEAANVRKEYDETSGKLSKIQSRISGLTKKLGHDFGPEKEFYLLYGQCFESKQNKYVYKVCPFKEASQMEGHSTTRLGQWEKFEDSYRVMVFSNGDKCWNGPDRSLKVRLRCGLKAELADVDEPGRCEYEALLTIPALCQEGKLKELQDKLEVVNKEQPEGHDEL